MVRFSFDDITFSSETSTLALLLGTLSFVFVKLVKIDFLMCRYRKVVGDTCEGGMEDQFSSETVSCPIPCKYYFVATAGYFVNVSHEHKRK